MSNNRTKTFDADGAAQGDILGVDGGVAKFAQPGVFGVGSDVPQFTHALQSSIAFGNSLRDNAIEQAQILAGLSRPVEFIVFDVSTVVALGDNAGRFVVPSEHEGKKLTKVVAVVIGDTLPGGANTVDVMLHSLTKGIDLLTTPSQISVGNRIGSEAVIKADQAEMELFELLRVDIDALSSTPPDGLVLLCSFGEL